MWIDNIFEKIRKNWEIVKAVFFWVAGLGIILWMTIAFLKKK
ncbi:MAG: hypothetical protein MRERV_14c056 [Mycoplasmataceae bacterium RV_VA103A]|nr:MAG: hypothetical protein MRERV_21c012 [Mycoplasmataceae bacterium RV_VA103A]KLL04707.1 MAG: hypothetical protein MRERV_14c056 [Mycoplasmataceae bacterium RV_VA103A]